MNWLDLLIVVIVGLFVLVGVLRGFIAEVWSVLTWVVSFAVAWWFSGDFTGWFAGRVKNADVRSVLVFFALFFAAFIIMTVGGRFVRAVWLSGTSQTADRILGGLVGFFKATAVLVILVLLAGLTPFPSDGFWRGSAFIGYFQGLALYVAHWLPADVARNLRYS